jgi:hypothetical protein
LASKGGDGGAGGDVQSLYLGSNQAIGGIGGNGGDGGDGGKGADGGKGGDAGAGGAGGNAVGGDIDAATGQPIAIINVQLAGSVHAGAGGSAGIPGVGGAHSPGGLGGQGGKRGMPTSIGGSPGITDGQPGAAGLAGDDGLPGLPASGGAAGKTGPDTVYDVATSPVSLSPTTLPAASINDSYSQTITATGGFGGPYTFSVLTGDLPPGLTLADDGTLDGIPSSVDDSPYTFTVAATDGNGDLGVQTYSLVVDTAPDFTPDTLPDAEVGVAYSQTLTATDGSGTGYTFAVTSGSLPAWLSLNPNTGVLSGTPTAADQGEQPPFIITVTDSLGASRSQQLFLNVGGIAVSPDILPALVVGDNYQVTFTASGGTGPYTYTLGDGTLPTGLSLSGGGMLTGKPSASGWFQFTIAATDSTGNVGTQSFALYVPTVALPSSIPAAVVGSPYDETVTAQNGNGSYTYAVSSGSLPSWLNLNTGTGRLSGTPTAPGTASFTIAATDGQGAGGSQAYVLTVDPPVVVGPPTLLDAAAGSRYDVTVRAAGGSGSGYTYSPAAGSLPNGLTLSSSGELSGTPTTTAGSPTTFTVLATDDRGAKGSVTYTLRVDPALTLGPATLPAATAGTPYDAFFLAGGGSGAGYTYLVTFGALPSGLGLNGTSGELSGTPGVSGNAVFSVTAADGAGHSATHRYVLTVNPPPGPPPGSPGPSPPPHQPVGPVSVMLVSRRFGRKTKQVAHVLFAGGLPPRDVIAPFQPPSYQGLAVMPQGFNADGTFSSLLFTAHKKKRKVRAVVAV